MRLALDSAIAKNSQYPVHLTHAEYDRGEWKAERL